MDNNTSVLNSNKSALIVVCGPTATGKTGLAIALSQRLGSPILSADSRQVYREFDIGTAKPTSEEQQQAPHYLIDICNPTETFTVADYQQQAQHLISLFHHKGKESGIAVPLLVGGTGLYIKAVTRGMKIPRVAPQEELRSQLAALGQPLCYALLKQVDPAACERIHGNDQVRTLRALEVFYVTGKPISEQQGEYPPHYPILQIGLDCGEPVPQEPDLLTERIRKRTQHLFEIGFIEEVETLGKRYGFDLPLLNTLGYAEVKQYLAGKISLDEAIAQTVLHTRQFAKRQRTWFRSDTQIEWFDSNHPQLVEQVWEHVQAWLSQWLEA
ncbi:tRNA (adenosine(37)-N6)-dimethylallyltransferase MiaA [Leptolyngbya sp. FACHB-8]|uniref:tRNA (adenosine(37)-N6)-dimethylallyltransferase MiaA n=1 Tax=unclassified Leptolyngbya TaxID=2650499 RepID=UPI0016868203|nr:tRNA (adenosine(37)-N6)-dimethylallyltransferase MiaA [Leptolyngbya sp. FACHB-8]MBD1912660.1 tRNA (adenosine(37)-N6)-dimethylallyltransferase MiaA [Leptolyngbya sp. FACHB-8]